MLADASGRVLAEFHHELNRMSCRSRMDVHLIDQALNEKEAPAARRLQPGELQIEAGRFIWEDLSAGPLVGDEYEQSVAGVLHADLDWDLGAIVVSVLDRVHRRFGHSRLEMLEARCRQHVRT